MVQKRKPAKAAVEYKVVSALEALKARREDLVVKASKEVELKPDGEYARYFQHVEIKTFKDPQRMTLIPEEETAMLRMLANCLILLLIPVSLTFAQDRKPAYLKAYERGGFAAIEDPVQFRDAHAFPPQLKGLTVDSGAKVDFRVTDSTDFEKRLTITTALALRDVRVKAAVGNRFATLGGGSIEPEKDAGGVDKGDTAVDFYNYDENRAYRAVLVGDRVVSVRAWPKGFQPKETRAEVQAAANIVAKDPAHARAVTGLEARGLRAPSERGDRLLYLLFYRGKERPAVYEATVNMSAGRVVRAEPIRN